MELCYNANPAGVRVVNCPPIVQPKEPAPEPPKPLGASEGVTYAAVSTPDIFGLIFLRQ
jgi:hypothetical protein